MFRQAALKFRLFARAAAVGILLAWYLAATGAHADSDPVIAIPGHLGIPVMIDGIDASGAVVTGDWGLSRPGHGYVLIEGGRPYRRLPVRPHFFPATGKPPKVGRDEIQTPTSHPVPPADFHRSWSAGSPTVPATAQPETPPMIIFSPPGGRPNVPLPPKTNRP